MNSGETYLLGVDVGTSRIKAALFDIDGKMAHYAWQNSRINADAGKSEIDMNDLWEDVAATISLVLAKAEGASVAAVAVSAQGEGLWLIDERGDPVQKAILWNDGRATGLINTLNLRPEIDQKIRSITGSSLFTGSTSVLLKWISENNPEKLESATKLIFCKDWIRYKLTGVVATDLTDASTSLLDIREATSSAELFQLLNIEKYLALLPSFCGLADKSGAVTEKAASVTGLKAGTPVATGAFDVVATAIGCGAINAGDACTILGTTGCNIVVSDGVSEIPNGRSGTEIHALSGQTINVSASMAATPNLDWVYNLLHDGKTYAEVEKKLEMVPAGSGGIIYHPYISQSGERAPFYSPGARAQFTGINETTTPHMMTRAVYEGVALSVRDCLEGQKPKRLFLAGGGSRSVFWAQIIANCTNLTVFVSSETETCARGSALMAGVAAGIYSDLETATDQVSKPKKFDPDPKAAELYNEIYKKYKQIRENMLPIWNG